MGVIKKGGIIKRMNREKGRSRVTGRRNGDKELQ